MRKPTFPSPFIEQSLRWTFKIMAALTITIFSLFIVGVLAAPQTKLMMQPTIIGGQGAKIEEFKYMGSLKKFGMHHCGGAVLNENWVVTAAHCFYRQEKDEYSFRTGTDDMFNGGDEYEIEKFIIHESYDPRTNDNDIALFKVKQNIKFYEKTFPLPLPSAEFSLVNGELATVTGWGYIEEGGPLSIELRVVRVPIIGRAKCAKLYDGFNNITESMICAGRDAGLKDACQGDSGGPLVVRGTLVGIVSWGKGCARPKAPGVYADVQYFRNWIQNYIEVKPIKKTIAITDFNASMLLNYVVS